MKIETKDFSLKDTYESGQPLTFHADYSRFERSETISYVEDMQIKINFIGNSKKGSINGIYRGNKIKKTIIERFRLNEDMKRVYENISTDDFLKEAIKKYYGMRLTISDPWETTVCFIISQFNNVKRIRGTVKKIIQYYGEPAGEDGAKYFPTSERIMALTERDLLKCGTGFRAKYLLSSAEYCTNNLDLDKLKGKKYEEIKEELMEMDGVGDKVADCIALMGYGNLNAFPIDRWVKRVLEEVYFKKADMKIEKLHDFADERWGSMAGYAQQYLFWHGRGIGKN